MGLWRRLGTREKRAWFSHLTHYYLRVNLLKVPLPIRSRMPNRLVKVDCFSLIHYKCEFSINHTSFGNMDNSLLPSHCWVKSPSLNRLKKKESHKQGSCLSVTTVIFQGCGIQVTLSKLTHLLRTPAYLLRNLCACWTNLGHTVHELHNQDFGGFTVAMCELRVHLMGLPGCTTCQKLIGGSSMSVMDRGDFWFKKA